jgi:HAD superfamily hydrolase (TIGR01509 family)
MPAQLVIFDFDGVLADSENIALEELALEISARGAPLTTDEAKAMFLGSSTARHMAWIAERTGRPCGEDFPGAWHARLFRRYAAELAAVEGAAATLDFLDARGVGYCIASGGSVDRIAFALDCLGLGDRFAGRAFSAETGARGKPAPDLFLRAAAGLGVAPAACLVVEDAPGGIEAAAAAGMAAIAFLGGGHLDGIRADHGALLSQRGALATAHDHAELRRLLAERV